MIWQSIKGRFNKVMDIKQRNQLEKISGRIHAWETFGTVDGPGLRTVFFLQGCPLNCIYCHNPDSLDINGGQPWSAKEVYDECAKYFSFTKNNGGVTLSGGEPLMQAEFCAAVIKLLHEDSIHCAIDTSGCILNDASKEAIKAADLILLDIKAHDHKLYSDITGYDGKKTWETLDFCQKNDKKVWIRHVVLKGYTLNNKHLEILADKLKCYSCIEKIELLPFHKMGEYKWKSLKTEYKLGNVAETTGQDIDKIKGIFLERGFGVH